MILDDIAEGRRAGVRCFIVTGNLWDLALIPGLAPARLSAVLAAALEREGYTVGLMSRSLGWQVFAGNGDVGPNRERAEWIHRVSGLRMLEGAGAPTAGGPGAVEAGEMLPRVARLLRQSERRVAVLLDFAQHFVPATPHGMAAVASPEQQVALEHLHRWGQDEGIRATDNLLILLAAEGAVHELLAEAGGYRLVRASLPSPEERRRFLTLLAGLRDRGRTEFAALAPDLGIEQAAALAAGLRLADLEALARGAAARGEPLSAEAIRREKGRTIAQRCGDLLEVLEPPCGLKQIAGLPHVVEYLGELVGRLKSGSRDVPRAILFMGVPGCGKTFVVGALAADLGWNCLIMRNILSKWVGESERNLEKAFRMAEEMRPCVFFIDEIDQALVRRGEGGDAGTSQRMLKRTMEFLAEERHRGSTLFVAATNAPHMLDPAIDDRFGVKLPFLHPSRAERTHLLPVVAAQIGRRPGDDVDPASVAAVASLEGSTVRGLLEVVAMAGHWTDADRADRVPGAPISQEYFLGTAAAYRPTCNPLQHEYIALIALRKTTFSSLYPWMRRVGVHVERRTGVDVPAYLQGIVDEETGEMHAEALDRRIWELGQALRLEAAQGRL